MVSMKRLVWLVWWAGVLAVLAILGCVALSVGAIARRPVKPWSGNLVRPDNQQAFIKIAVFGDTQKGLAGFAALAEKAKAEGISLAVHTGDLVSHADVGHYDLALKWVLDAYPQGGVPFVVVPGNHDIKGRPGLFEARIGPRQTAFSWGPVDVVIVDNAVASPDLAAVDALLKKSAGRPILVFMH